MECIQSEQSKRGGLLMFAMMVTLVCNCNGISYLEEQKKLSPDDMKTIANSNDDTHLSNTLNQILKPRVVGSQGHEDVKQYIINELTSLNMQVNLDAFATTVPVFGNVTFTNIVATVNENADSFLALACHYDSKYFADFEFLAAIDSAVPCAVMLNIAKTLMPSIDRDRSDVSLMLIFFDGEEAFESWTAEDSLYGSRHLATKMGSRGFYKTNSQDQIRDIDRIDVLVLIDLIGASSPRIFNFYQRTQGLFMRMLEIERSLFRAGLMAGHRYMFVPKNSYSGVDDDHRPFLEKDVPIVHLIPVPFPDQWHKASDNLENLDGNSIGNFNKILRVFTIEYLQSHQASTNFRFR